MKSPGKGHVSRNTGQSLEAEIGPQLTARKKMRMLVLQPQASELCQQSHEFRIGPDA